MKIICVNCRVKNYVKEDQLFETAKVASITAMIFFHIINYAY